MHKSLCPKDPQSMAYLGSKAHPLSKQTIHRPLQNRHNPRCDPACSEQLGDGKTKNRNKNPFEERYIYMPMHLFQRSGSYHLHRYRVPNCILSPFSTKMSAFALDDLAIMDLASGFAFLSKCVPVMWSACAWVLTVVVSEFRIAMAAKSNKKSSRIRVWEDDGRQGLGWNKSHLTAIFEVQSKILDFLQITVDLYIHRIHQNWILCRLIPNQISVCRRFFVKKLFQS